MGSALMAVALAEAGARAVYYVDLPHTPGDEWQSVQRYLAEMDSSTGNNVHECKFEYLNTDVLDQENM